MVGGRTNVLQPHIKGISLVDRKNEQGYLIVVNQGRKELAIFGRADHEYKGSISIEPGEQVDGAKDLRRIHTINAPLPRFPEGVLLIEDNDKGIALPNTKLVDARKISRALKSLQR